MKKKHRIAVCCEGSLLWAQGVEVVVRTLLEGILAKYEVVLVSGGDAGEFKGPIAHIHWDSRKAGYASAQDLARQLKALDVELVHFHANMPYAWGSRVFGRHPAIACRRIGLPCLLTTHLLGAWHWGYCGPQKPLWFKLALFPWAWLSRLHFLGYLELEVAVSNENRDFLRRLWFPFKNRIQTLYHSRIHENRKQPVVEPREKMILNVASIAPRKGQLILIKAFTEVAAQYPDWMLGIVGHVGDKNYFNQIQEVVRANGLEARVRFFGVLDEVSVDDLLCGVSIFAFPSFIEALGLALEEALFAGCPSVGSKVGGIPELIEPGRNGLLVAPGSVRELADALALLMGDPALLRTLSDQCRVSILEKGFTAEKMVENYTRIYDHLLTP